MSFDWLKSQSHGEVQRNDGANLNQLCGRRKSGKRQADSIDAKRKVLRGVATIVSNLEIQMELIAFTDEFARRRDRGALLVTHLNLQFSAIALRGSGNHVDAYET